MEQRLRPARMPDWLPRGRTLTDGAWEQRHLWMVRLAVANAVGLFLFALYQGNGLFHSIFEGAVVASFAVVAAYGPRSRTVRSGAVSLGLLASSAVLVHLSEGAIEAHFHFFVMIAVLSLYEDWVPFLLAVAFVLVHHGLAGVLAPDSVYAHADAVADPIKWAIIHAVFVAGAGAANVLAWRLHEQTRDHMRRLAAIVESSSDAILSVSADGTALSWNEGAQRLFGWDPEEVLGERLDAMIPHDRAVEADETLRRVLAGERVEQLETERVTKDGDVIAVRLSASALRDPRGEIVGASAIMQDVTDRRQADEELSRERRRLSEAEKIGQMGNWEWDLDRDRVTWSPQLYRLFGLRPEEFEASLAGYMELVHPADRPMMEMHVARAIETKRYDPIDHRIIRPDGEIRHVLVRAEIATSPRGGVSRMVGTAIDITDRKQAEVAIRESQAALAHQALHDGLTGLPNRTLMQDRLQHALQRCRRDEHQLALLFVDVDRFKVVNDSLGHAAGDELLIQFAARLDEELRPADTVARFGGDEFAVLCEDIAREQDAIALAERVLQAVSRPFVLGGREHFATVSVGVALSDRRCTTESLIRDADVAMYRAKERGASRYELFDGAMRQRSVERMQIENELRRAVRENELRLHYQPIVSLDDGSTVAAEALVRWEHPERGLLGPGQFIGIAEESTLITSVGGWVLDEACRQLAEWEPELPEGFWLSVNVSARQFADPQLVETVRRALEGAGVPAHRLSIELTETALMQGDACFAALLELKQLGVRVVLDDFGTGYSSLSYLSCVPFDGLKIDRSFVARLTIGDAERSIVAAVGTMADALDLSVVAEGIETAEQREALVAMGYRLGQGFLYSEPVPPHEFPLLARSVRRG